MLVSQRVKIYYRTPDFVSVKQYCNVSIFDQIFGK